MNTVITELLRVGLQHMGYRVDGTDLDRLADSDEPDKEG